MRPFKKSFSLLYKSFLQPLFIYPSPVWFLFLSVTNIFKLKRFYQAASRAITSCPWYCAIPVFLFEKSLSSNEPFWDIMLCNFMSGLFVVYPLFLFQNWPDLNCIRGFWSSCDPLVPSSCLLTPSFLEIVILYCRTHFFVLRILALTFVFLAKWVLFFNFPSSHNFVIWTDGFASVPFGKEALASLPTVHLVALCPPFLIWQAQCV